MVPRFLRGCLLAIAIMACSPAAFAGKVELTTYYPSPYGEYMNLKNAADSFFATSSGNVGIGTTTAISKLDVLGTLSVGNAATAGAIGKVQITTGGASPINNRLTFGTDGTGWKFAIGKNQGGTVTEYMTFQDNGNVGIGTTNPTVKLEVAGTIKSNQPFWTGYFVAQTGTNFIPVIASGTMGVKASGVTLTGGNTLNIPTTGLYHINVRQYVWVAAGGIYLFIQKNGVGVSCAFSNPPTAETKYNLNLQSTVLVSCNAGDTIRFYFQGTTTIPADAASSELSVVMVN